jgi:hypothetical protein
MKSGNTTVYRTARCRLCHYPAVIHVVMDGVRPFSCGVLVLSSLSAVIILRSFNFAAVIHVVIHGAWPFLRGVLVLSILSAVIHAVIHGVWPFSRGVLVLSTLGRGHSCGHSRCVATLARCARTVILPAVILPRSFNSPAVIQSRQPFSCGHSCGHSRGHSRYAATSRAVCSYCQYCLRSFSFCHSVLLRSFSLDGHRPAIIHAVIQSGWPLCLRSSILACGHAQRPVISRCLSTVVLSTHGSAVWPRYFDRALYCTVLYSTVHTYSCTVHTAFVHSVNLVMAPLQTVDDCRHLADPPLLCGPCHGCCTVPN